MSRRRGRGNAKARLQKQLAIQRDLENELQQLNSGTQDTPGNTENIDDNKIPKIYQGILI